MKTILTIGRYFKATHGGRVRKIPISLQGFTCPNIDGTLSRGGCIYCKNESFSPALESMESLNFLSVESLSSNPQTPLNPQDSITMHPNLRDNPLLDSQIATLKSQFFSQTNSHKERFGESKYMIYFQSYSNTYAPYATLQRLYDEALNLNGVVGMAIGTRIDSVEERVLDLLGGYVRDKNSDIWLEYGIQSIFDKTLKFINRAHGIAGAKELVERTRERGIKVCVHLIYGLPREDSKMMMESLREVLSWGIDGIKIHPLYVVRGTPLEKMYESGKYTPISLEEFSDLVVESLKIIPENVVVQRISASSHNDELIAPKWCFDKNIQMNLIRDKLLRVGIKY